MRIVAAALAVLLIATSTMLVKFKVDNNELRMQVADLGARTPAPPTYVPALFLETLDGSPIELASGHRQTFLVFTTTCGFCLETMPVWRALLDSAPQHAQIVGLSLDSESATRQYVAEQFPAAPIVVLDEKERSLFGLGPVPHVMTVDEEGRIIYSRKGSLARVGPIVLDSVRKAIGGTSS